MEVKIEKGIPAPSANYQRTKYGFVHDMEVGDSVVVPDTLTVRAGIYAAARYAKIRIAIRSQPDGTLRVWRVK